jgi:hypothetical protein
MLGRIYLFMVYLMMLSISQTIYIALMQSYYVEFIYSLQKHHEIVTFRE